MRRLLALLALGAALACDSTPQTFDLIISGGEVYDGVSLDPHRLDIAINGDRIAGLGGLDTALARRRIDATGFVVAPGFIDVQSRSGISLLTEASGESHLRQGITSEIIGDMQSPAFWNAATADRATLKLFGLTFDWEGPDGYFARLLARGTPVNVGTLIPLSMVDGTEAAVEAAMRRGALGLSVMRGTGRVSAPITNLMPLAKVVAAHGGVIAVTLALAGAELLQAVDEVIQLASDARVAVTIYQPEEDDPSVLGELVARVMAARARGLRVHTTMTPDGGEARASRAYWLRDSGASIGSQSAAVHPGGLLAGRIGQSRVDDAFATVFARYVREEHVISLGAAIQRMTSSAAGQFGLDGRGVLAEGNFADLVVFDPRTIRPSQANAVAHEDTPYVRHVIVNGVPVFDASGVTGARPGRVLAGRARVERSPS
jgi:N-acyl-D-aspartate/D-glutamate deacylase